MILTKTMKDLRKPCAGFSEVLLIAALLIAAFLMTQSILVRLQISSSLDIHSLLRQADGGIDQHAEYCQDQDRCDISCADR